MTNLKFIATFLLTTFYACKQNPAKHRIDPAAVQLNKNPDSIKKAILLLDKATEIDSSYFRGYTNKLMFYNGLKQFDKALLTNNKLIQLRPTAHDLYLRSGLLYTQLGDTANAKIFFAKGLAICNLVLDTMTNTNRDYVMLTTNQAIALTMLGDTAKANKNLQALYDNLPNDPKFDNVEKKFIQSLRNKSRTELIDFLNNPNK